MTVLQTFKWVVTLIFCIPISITKCIILWDKTVGFRSQTFFALLVQMACGGANRTVYRYAINPLCIGTCWLLQKWYGYPSHESGGFWLRTPFQQCTGCKEVVLYLHGGGFASEMQPLSILCLQPFLEELRNDIAVLAYKYPVLADCPQAIDSVWAEYCRLTQTFDRVHLIGDSCGGNLILNVLLDSQRTGMPLPPTAICISPWCNVLDLETIDTKKCTGTNVDLLSVSTVTTFRDLYLQNVAYPAQLQQKLDFKAVPRKDWVQILEKCRLYINYGELEAFRTQIELFLKHIGTHPNLVVTKIPNGVHVSPLIFKDMSETRKWAQLINE